jgi:hypothetical protein
MSGIYRNPGWVWTSDGKGANQDGDTDLDGINDAGWNHRFCYGPRIPGGRQIYGPVESRTNYLNIIVEL